MNDQSVGSAVARRQSTSEIEAKLQGAIGWYDIISPSHMPARQLVALAVAELRQDDKLAEAAQANPESFMVAVAECARLGLVPGDKFHLVGFNDKNAKGGKAVTGITDYRGEMELAFRTGEVESIHCEVVRAKDHFRWAPTEMRVPEHRVKPNASGQQGLADQEDRGHLTGVYAYARMTNGGISQCVVMPRSEVMKHRAIAKTDKFWGPDWPKEGPWTPAMWEKTALHELSDYLPDSPEYMKAKAEQATRIAEAPVPPEVERERERQRQQEQAETPDFGSNDVPHPQTIAGQVEQNGRGRDRRENRDDIVNGIAGLFQNAGLAMGDQRFDGARETLLLVMANADGPPVDVASWNKLTNAQLATARLTLGNTIVRAREGDRDPAEVLLGIATAAGWQDPAATEGNDQ